MSTAGVELDREAFEKGAHPPHFLPDHVILTDYVDGATLKRRLTSLSLSLRKLHEVLVEPSSITFPTEVLRSRPQFQDMSEALQNKHLTLVEHVESIKKQLDSDLNELSIEIMKLAETLPSDPSNSSTAAENQRTRTQGTPAPAHRDTSVRTDEARDQATPSLPSLKRKIKRLLLEMPRNKQIDDLI